MVLAIHGKGALALATAAGLGLASMAQAAPLPDLSDWHEAAQKAAKAMQEEYGDPE